MLIIGIVCLVIIIFNYVYGNYKICYLKYIEASIMSNCTNGVIFGESITEFLLCIYSQCHQVDNFILDGIEMNPEGMRQLYRHIKTQDPSASCHFEVTDEGKCGIDMLYQSTTALSCVTVVGSPLLCEASCSLYQGTCDSEYEVRIQYANYM